MVFVFVGVSVMAEETDLIDLTKKDSFEYPQSAIKQKAEDVARQIEIYIRLNPEKTIEDLQVAPMVITFLPSDLALCNISNKSSFDFSTLFAKSLYVSNSFNPKSSSLCKFSLTLSSTGLYLKKV